MRSSRQMTPNLPERQAGVESFVHYLASIKGRKKLELSGPRPRHSPRCSSITVLSVRGTVLLLIFACPRFKMSSRTDFRFGNLHKAQRVHWPLRTDQEEVKYSPTSTSHKQGVDSWVSLKGWLSSKAAQACNLTPKTLRLEGPESCRE